MSYRSPSSSRVQSPFDDHFEPISMDESVSIADDEEQRRSTSERTPSPRSLTVGRQSPSKLKEIRISEFDPNEMDPASKILVIGRPKTGKSTLCSDICSFMSNKVPVWEVFNGSEVSNKYWKNRGIPDIFVHPDLDLESVNRFYTRQRISIQQKVNPAYGGLLFDDCMHDNKLFKDRVFKKIMFNGRNDKIFTMIITQDASVPPRWLRSTIDYVFLFRETSEENLRILHKNFGSIIGTYGDFVEIMKEVAHTNRCLVINFQKQSNNMEDMVAWYKADITEKPVPLGSLDIWDWHRERYNADYVDPV